MTKKTEDQRLLETSRNQWRSFELRQGLYSAEQRSITAKAILDCADTLSRYLAIGADDIIFGRSAFTTIQAELLITGLRKLQNHALAQRFDCGATAILALKAVASLVILEHKTKVPLIRQQREKDLAVITASLARLIDDHREATFAHPLAAQ